MNDPTTRRIVEFLTGIGIEVRRGEVAEIPFLPGTEIRRGALVYNEEKLLYPGDLLHEAGHLAVTPAAERSELDANLGADGGLEMGAIAWSYAAALEIGIDPAVVFHPHGYKGGSESLLENFKAGRPIGVPILQWAGLTDDQYPRMLRWLRE